MQHIPSPTFARHRTTGTNQRFNPTLCRGRVYCAIPLTRAAQRGLTWALGSLLPEGCLLAQHFKTFCNDWLSKAKEYDDQSLEGCYDKFFTLFVVFNRLYAEATFELARRQVITIQANRPLPDRKGATEYTLLFVGQDDFDQLIEEQLASEVAELTRLIEDEHFHIKLSAPNGDPQREKDQSLLRDLRSRGKTRALAVLDVVYSIRCNLFHGHKAFQQVQAELLRPAIRVVYQVVHALLRAHGA